MSNMQMAKWEKIEVVQGVSHKILSALHHAKYYSVSSAGKEKAWRYTI